MFARVAVLTGNVEGEIRGAKVVALRLVGLEGALLDLELDLSMRGEEGGERERFGVGAGQVACAIGLRQMLEGLGPRVLGERVPAGLHGIRRCRGGQRVDLGHAGHCATRATGSRC